MTSAKKPIEHSGVAIFMDGVDVTRLLDPDVVVLERVSWTANTGDFWVIGGLHGSGKNALMDLAAGLSSPKSGTYQLFGKEMPIFDPKFLRERLRIGRVFDDAKLFSHLTVRENISLPLRYHETRKRGEIEGRMKALLEFTELGGQADARPGAISPAWRRRAALARALTLNPDVLLLDIPASGLDARHLNWWLETLDQLSAGHEIMGKRPMTIVVTAENLRPWRQRARQFAILKDKRFISLGDCSHLTERDEPMLAELTGV